MVIFSVSVVTFLTAFLPLERDEEEASASGSESEGATLLECAAAQSEASPSVELSSYGTKGLGLVALVEASGAGVEWLALLVAVDLDSAALRLGGLDLTVLAVSEVFMEMK